MAAVHITTMPCEPSTANWHMESHILCEIRPCTNNIWYARFEVFRTFFVSFYDRFNHEGFHTLRVMGKCTSLYLFRYVGLWPLAITRVKFG